MKFINQIRGYFDRIKSFLGSEKELLRLKLIRTASKIAANLALLILLLMIFHIVLATTAVWLGFYLGEVLESLPWGFGISALIFLSIFVLLIVFRKPLIIKPVVNAAIKQMVNFNKLPDEDQKSG